MTTLAEKLRTAAGSRLLNATVSELCDLINEAADDIESYETSFNLRWDADMRAIKRWQTANPGNDLTWPDHADLVVWLLDQREVTRR